MGYDHKIPMELMGFWDWGVGGLLGLPAAVFLIMADFSYVVIKIEQKNRVNKFFIDYIWCMGKRSYCLVCFYL